MAEQFISEPIKPLTTTSDTARIRNEFVAALADKVFVSYAVPGGKTELFCRKILAWGKPLLTFDSLENAPLFAVGARPLS